MDEKNQTEPFNVRGLTTFIVALTFLLVTITGIALYVMPRGRAGGWQEILFDKRQWAAVHMVASFILVAAGCLHLYFNWRVFTGYFRARCAGGLRLKRELALALVLGLAIVLGTILNIPPFSCVPGWSHDIKSYWSDGASPGFGGPPSHAQPPEGHGRGAGRRHRGT